MENKVALVCPYFGKLPNYFNVFMKSCAFNKEFNWIILTDDNLERFGEIPDNIQIVKCSFQMLKEKIQSKFDFNISLESPYKLCDFKPCYGYVFDELLKEYDFWGHCDIDCIYGNLSNFITDDILNKYNKISYLGHLILYRNERSVNLLFKEKLDKYDYTYKEVLSNPEIYVFDESFQKLSLNTIFIEKNIPMYDKQLFADVCCLYKDFRLYNYDEHYNYLLEKRSNQIFKWDHGVLTSHSYKNKKECIKEYAYLHIQKRKMNVEFNLDDNVFFVVPNSFVKNDDISKIYKKYRTYAPFNKKMIELKVINKLKK